MLVRFSISPVFVNKRKIPAAGTPGHGDFVINCQVLSQGAASTAVRWSRKPKSVTAPPR